MKRACILAFLAMPVSSWAQSSIAPPELGFVADAARALRPVYGVAGSFVLGPAVAGGVSNAAFSGSLGLLKTDSSLAAFDARGALLGSTPAPAGSALFAFAADGTAALAYLSAGAQLVEWSGAQFATIPLDPQPDGDVIAIGFPSATAAVLIVERERGIWELNISLNGGGETSQDALPGIHAPVLPLASDGLLYTDHGVAVIRRGDGSQVRLPGPLPRQFSLQQLGRDWVELSDLQGPARFAIHTATGREAFYWLPEQTTEPSR
jgi:hypothetical protein